MEDFIEGFGITQNKLAVSIGVPPRRINEIVHGKRGITADTALRLGKLFGTTAQFWLNLQTLYDQIGRASCREREEIAVGGVSLKEQKKERGAEYDSEKEQKQRQKA